jgi:urea transport system substrate-binding protein
MYRGLKLWEAAVNEAGSLDQADVIEALDHAKIAEGPAQASNGAFKVVKDLGVIDPKEAVLAIG